MANGLSQWSAGICNRHFERPALMSFPFAAVTLLTAICLAHEAWIVAARWPRAPPGGWVLFSSMAAMTPLVWLKGLVQRRHYRGRGIRADPPADGGLSDAGLIAADYLYTATFGYLLLSIALSFVPR